MDTVFGESEQMLAKARIAARIGRIIHQRSRAPLLSHRAIEKTTVHVKSVLTDLRRVGGRGIRVPLALRGRPAHRIAILDLTTHDGYSATHYG